MSSDIQSALELLQMNDYLSLVAVTAVTYDYFLTLPSEIQYVWRRPWTWVSIMFILVRYVGLSWAILAALNATTFIPGPVEVGTAVAWMYAWTFQIFLNTADLIMILRVYAMWNRSKKILYLLLFIYVPQVIISVVFAGVYNTTAYLSITIVQIMGFSFCNPSWSNTPFVIDMFDEIPRFALGAMLLILAVAQTLKQSVSMSKATKQWQPNRYMGRLVKDGVLYFLVNMFSIIAGVVVNVDPTNTTLPLFLGIFSIISLCPMMPRFIISVRELYDHDVRRGWQDVDTGFGVLSQPISSEDTLVSAIAFADVPPTQVVEGDANESEAIRLEPSGDHAHQV